MKVRRRSLIWGGVGVATFVVAAICVVALGLRRYRSLIDSAVSRALGTDFEILGKAAFHPFPRPHLTLRDVHLLHGKTEILSAERLQAFPRWIPFLFHGQLSIDGVVLLRPKIRIERSSQGPGTTQPQGPIPPGTISLISVDQGEITYLDRSSGRSVELEGLDLNLTDISWDHVSAASSLVLLKALSLHGTLHADTLQVGTFKASDVRCAITDEAGLLQLDSLAVALFGGTSRGSLTVDVRSTAPRIRLVQAAAQIDLTQVYPVQIFFGRAQASLDVEGTGNDARAVASTMKGQASIRSDHISLNVDIDAQIAAYERTQNFSFIDLAALVIVGPFAPLVTKGVDYSRLIVFGHPGHAKSEIHKVVSDWILAGGIAKTSDVAFTTPQHTVAFRGELNLITGNYQHLFVATVDRHGCSTVIRPVSGPVAHPSVGAAPSQVIGPFKAAFQNAEKLVHNPCDHFYAGSALP